MQLEQGTMTILEYEKKFNELSKYCVPLVEDENKKCQLFTRGLKASIRYIVISQRLTNFGDLVMFASLIESSQMMVRARGEPQRRQFDMGGPIRGHPREAATALGHLVAAVMEVFDLESVLVEDPTRVAILGTIPGVVQLQVLGDSYSQHLVGGGIRSVLSVVGIIPGLADSVPPNVSIVVSLDIL